MSTEAALWAAIATHPGEDAPKLALADWYGEHSRPEMLHAIKWCVQRGKWPRRTPKGTQAIWYGSSRTTAGRFAKVDASHALPTPVLGQFPASRSRNAEMRFSSLQEAVTRLAAALDKLRRAYEVTT